MGRTIRILTAVCGAIILISLLIIGVRPPGTGNTVQEAVMKSGRTVFKVIHEEKVKDGVVIFYLKNSFDLNKADLAAGYVKKTLWGWKWIYGGEHGSINSYCADKGFSSQYFPNAEGTPFPLYFGAINNPKISMVKVVEQERNISIGTKTVESKDFNIWYTFMNNSKGSKFNITALSKDGEVLGTENTDISPFSADQKPIKQ